MNMIRIKREVWLLKRGPIAVPGKDAKEAASRAHDLGIITADEWVVLDKKYSAPRPSGFGGGAA